MKKRYRKNEMPQTIASTHIVGEHGSVVVSTMRLSFSGPETMVFLSDKDGQILSWRHIDEDRYSTIKKAQLGHEKVVRKYTRRLGSSDWLSFLNSLSVETDHYDTGEYDTGEYDE